MTQNEAHACIKEFAKKHGCGFHKHDKSSCVWVGGACVDVVSDGYCGTNSELVSHLEESIKNKVIIPGEALPESVTSEVSND